MKAKSPSLFGCDNDVTDASNIAVPAAATVIASSPSILTSITTLCSHILSRIPLLSALSSPQNHAQIRHDKKVARRRQKRAANHNSSGSESENSSSSSPSSSSKSPQMAPSSRSASAAAIAKSPTLAKEAESRLLMLISPSGPLHRRKLLALDLDETLVHSSTQPLKAHNYSVSMTIESTLCTFYVSERPHLRQFMDTVCEWYDVVIFTASVKGYADPVCDRIDPKRRTRGRYFRETCVQRSGVFVKDMSKICADLSSCILIDNSPLSYSMNQENAIPIESWYTDQHDQALLNVLPLLDALRFTQDVRSVLSLRLLRYGSPGPPSTS